MPEMFNQLPVNGFPVVHCLEPSSITVSPLPLLPSGERGRPPFAGAAASTHHSDNDMMQMSTLFFVFELFTVSRCEVYIYKFATYFYFFLFFMPLFVVFFCIFE